jgi:hypothetical protein
LTSLVAAVPAGFLTYLLVMAFLNHVGNMSGMAMGLAGTTLAVSAFLTLTPFGIFVFGGPKKKKAAVPKAAPEGKKAEAKKAEAAASSSEVAGLVSSGEAHVLDSDTELKSDAVVMDEELEDTTAFETPMSNPEIELRDSDTFGSDEIDRLDAIDEEVIVEEEDDEPKRKKKKKR